MTPEGAYHLRRHPEAGEFRKAWDAALACGVQRLEDIAMDRALNGVEVPVYSYGKLVGARRVYNDRLLMFLLRNRAPDRFAGGKAKALSALDAATVARLKTQWREEFEREHALAEAVDARAAGDDFVALIRERHRRWWAGLTPRARAAYIDFRRIESEDRDAASPDAEDLEDFEDEEDQEDRAADYAATFDHHPRAPVDLLAEADGIGDAAVLGPDLPAQAPHHRLIVITGDGWDFRRDEDDGRCLRV